MWCLPIDYLTRLNYPDLKNLFLTCKYFSTICSNQSLKDILFLKTQIQLPVHIDINEIMKNVDYDIMTLIYSHYPDLPRWVNQELFLVDFSRDIYQNLIDTIMEILEDNLNYENKTFDNNLYCEVGTFNIELWKAGLAFALCSDWYDIHEDVILENNLIILSKELVEYIMFGVNYYLSNNEFDRWDCYRLVEQMLFV